MSAFICSDLHFSTIAIYIHHLNDNIDVQYLANKLKSINIDSVNYRYNENTRKSKCKIINDFNNTRFSKYDIVRLIQCWNYQSCEKGDNQEFLIISAFLDSFFSNDERENARFESDKWSI